ncbi:MAG: hypothetical protein FJX25_17825 [Alphaproteobacteria bacterium]|nr:hypothetical protein [Alphaproteobacteria bacterium]
MRVRDQIGISCDETMLAEPSGARRPWKIGLWRLALATLCQFLEHLSAVRGPRRCVSRIDWSRRALSLELTDQLILRVEA